LAPCRQLSLTLPAAVTTSLLNRVAAAFHARINDILLTAFVLSTLQWRRLNSTKATSLLIDLEGHGREGIPDVDLSRTVGCLRPYFLSSLISASWTWKKLAPEAGGWLPPSSQSSGQLGTIPDNGVGYGLLRYLNTETAQALSALPQSQIDFNYLGRFPASEAADWSSSESISGGMDPAMPFHHALEIDSMVLERSAGPELRAIWTWMPSIFFKG